MRLKADGLDLLDDAGEIVGGTGSPDELTQEQFDLCAELARRWNAFEPGGEVERLRAALENLLNFHEKKCHEGPYLEAARAALAAAKGGAA